MYLLLWTGDFFHNVLSFSIIVYIVREHIHTQMHTYVVPSRLELHINHVEKELKFDIEFVIKGA